MTKPTKINYFRSARNGAELSCEFVRVLTKEFGMRLRACSYSDTREEWDISFEHDETSYVMFVGGSTIEFRPTKTDKKDWSYLDSVKHSYSNISEPRTLETMLYQIRCALNGERFDRDMDIGDTVILYFHKGEVWGDYEF